MKQAMRDDRYWQGSHPENEDYRNWVLQGWQELGDAGALEGDGTIVVQVSGYSRTRNGRRERVEPYQQRRRAAQDEANDNPAPAAAPPQPAPPAPAPESNVVVVFVGGGGDRWFTRQVAGYSEGLRDQFPALAGVRTEHFDWDQEGRIERFIRAQPSGTSVRLVGHSWGGDTAAKVAAALGQDGIRVDMLVTVDPVGNNDADRPAAIAEARQGARRWINIRAGGPWWEQSNIVARIGGRWGGDARGTVDAFEESPASHGNFAGMMLQRVGGGRTVLELVTGRALFALPGSRS